MRAIINVLERHPHVGGHGVVDQDFDPAELVDRGGDELVDLLRRPYVAAGSHGLASDLPDLRRYRVGTFLLDVGDGNVGALSSQRKGDPPSDTPTGPGDDGGLLVKIAHGSQSFRLRDKSPSCPGCRRQSEVLGAAGCRAESGDHGTEVLEGRRRFGGQPHRDPKVSDAGR